VSGPARGRRRPSATPTEQMVQRFAGVTGQRAIFGVRVEQTPNRKQSVNHAKSVRTRCGQLSKASEGPCSS
jgi:hypothetical protein